MSRNGVTRWKLSLKWNTIHGKFCSHIDSTSCTWNCSTNIHNNQSYTFLPVFYLLVIWFIWKISSKSLKYDGHYFVWWHSLKTVLLFVSAKWLQLKPIHDRHILLSCIADCSLYSRHTVLSQIKNRFAQWIKQKIITFPKPNITTFYRLIKS